MIKKFQGTEELKEMQESVKDFIKFHYIPKSLSRRMQESFEHTWNFTNGTINSYMYLDYALAN